MIDRRSVFIGGAAIATAASLPVDAFAESRGFDGFPKNMIRVDWAADGPMAVVSQPVTKDDIHVFPSYRDFLKAATGEQVLWQEEIWQHWRPYGDVTFAQKLRVVLSRHSTLIAHRTRRGSANIIEISPDDIFDTKNAVLPWWRIKVNPDLRNNEILIYYDGRPDDHHEVLDAGFRAKRLPSGQVKALVIPRDPKFMGVSYDYALLLRII